MSTKQNTKPSKASVELSIESILTDTNTIASVVLTESIARQTCKDTCSKLIPRLHQAGVVVGRRNGANACPIAAMFYDTLIAGGLAAKTSSNYLTTFKTAVESGKPPTDWNLARKGKGKKKKAPKEFSALLIPAFNHENGSSFEELCKRIQSGYDDGKFDVLYEGFIDYLKSEGIEITE